MSTTPDVLPALASDEELNELRETGSPLVQRVLARLDAAEKREKALREAGEELCNAACDIRPTAPSSASIDRLNKAIDAWPTRAALEAKSHD